MSNDLKQLSIYQLIVSGLWPQFYYFGSDWSYAPLESHVSVFPNLPFRPVDRMIHLLVEGLLRDGDEHKYKPDIH